MCLIDALNFGIGGNLVHTIRLHWRRLRPPVLSVCAISGRIFKDFLMLFAPQRPLLTTTRRAARLLALLVLLPVTTLLVGTLPGNGVITSAYAADEDKPALAVVHFVKRGDAGMLSVQRIEEYLRQMLDAGGAVKMLPAKVVELGKPLTGPVRPAAAANLPVSPQAKAIEKADKLVAAARDIVAEGEALADGIKLLAAAVERYEANFVELADFSKLVDAYALNAQALLMQGDTKGAAEWVARALAIQPTFVVDGRKQNKDLKAVVDKSRDGLEAKPRTTIAVESTQPDSEVYVDGVKIGTAPATASDLLAGVHFVQVRKAGASPWGQQLLAKGKPLQTKAILQMQVAPENEIAISVSPDDIKEFANKGNFGEKIFKNSAALFARQIAATHILFGLVNRRPSTLELHLFVFSTKTKKTCSVSPIEYAANLNNLQMQTLDAEGKVRIAVLNCATDVSGVPAIYANAPQPKDEPVAPDIVPTPPDAEPKADVTDDPKPEPKPEPKPQPKPEPRRADVLKKVEKDDPYKDLLKDSNADATDKPFYTTWWFWTAVGVVAVGGGGAGAYAATRGGNVVTGYGVKVTVP
ncbi:MAG: PEGA domain-containing protein [Myxococcales bacterium]|nr:PEGA domain-containing protein [Myxococcales bacterium]